MADVSLVKVALAMALGLVLAGVLAVVLARLARGGKGLFRAAFLTLLCVYALGFAARYVLVEELPAAGILERLPALPEK